MKNILFAVTILAVIIVFFVPAVRAEGRLHKRINNCAKVMDEMMLMPEKSIPKSLLRQAKAICIFPNTVKGGFIWGGRYGQGVMLSRDGKNGKWSNPAFFTIGEVSWGLQIGGQATDLILIIVGENSMEGLLKDNVTIGADVSVAAGPVGRDVEVNAEILLKGGIFSYSRTKGAFAGASVQGAIITPNNVANRTYYGADVTTSDILIGRETVDDSSANGLKQRLEEYTK